MRKFREFKIIHERKGINRPQIFESLRFQLCKFLLMSSSSLLLMLLLLLPLFLLPSNYHNNQQHCHYTVK
jgi:hypothetical protein